MSGMREISVTLQLKGCPNGAIQALQEFRMRDSERRWRIGAVEEDDGDWLLTVYKSTDQDSVDSAIAELPASLRSKIVAALINVPSLERLLTAALSDKGSFAEAIRKTFEND